MKGKGESFEKGQRKIEGEGEMKRYHLP